MGNLPQIRLEPVLKAHAEKLAGSNPERTIRFRHELVDLKQDSDRVTATISEMDTGRRYTIRSLYLIGADGGRTVPKLGGINISTLVPMRGRIQTTLHLSYDFSPFLQDESVLLRWIRNPDGPLTCTLLPMGPNQWGTKSEEWTNIRLGGENGRGSQITSHYDSLDSKDTIAINSVILTTYCENQRVHIASSHFNQRKESITRSPSRLSEGSTKDNSSVGEETSGIVAGHIKSVTPT
jgi:hypothetical protein